MKNLIIIFISIILVKPSYGQTFCAKCDSVSLNKDSTKYIGYLKGKAIDSMGSILYEEKEKYDTIPVVMFVCDTSKGFQIENIVDSSDGEVYLYGTANQDNKLYWRFGWSVRQFSGYRNANTGTYAVYISEPVYTSIQYLDDKKQPLIPSIIVWQSINRK